MTKKRVIPPNPSQRHRDAQRGPYLLERSLEQRRGRQNRLGGLCQSVSAEFAQPSLVVVHTSAKRSFVSALIPEVLISNSQQERLESLLSREIVQRLLLTHSLNHYPRERARARAKARGGAAAAVSTHRDTACRLTVGVLRVFLSNISLLPLGEFPATHPGGNAAQCNK